MRRVIADAEFIDLLPSPMLASLSTCNEKRKEFQVSFNLGKVQSGTVEHVLEQRAPLRGRAAFGPAQQLRVAGDSLADVVLFVLHLLFYLVLIGRFARNQSSAPQSMNNGDKSRANMTFLRRAFGSQLDLTGESHVWPISEKLID